MASTPPATAAPLNQLSLGHILAFILWGSRLVRHSSSCIARLTLLGKYALPIPGRKCGLYFYISLAFFFRHSHSTILQSGNSQFVMTKIHLFRPKYVHFLWPKYTFFETPKAWRWKPIGSICIISQVLNHIRSFIDLSNYSYLKMKTENIK